MTPNGGKHQTDIDADVFAMQSINLTIWEGWKVSFVDNLLDFEALTITKIAP